MNETNYCLTCPFLNDSAEYARGVEFGMLYERMKAKRRIKDVFHVDNQERITLLANRSKWHIVSMEDCTLDWVWIDLEPPPSDSYVIWMRAAIVVLAALMLLNLLFWWWE